MTTLTRTLFVVSILSFCTGLSAQKLDSLKIQNELDSLDNIIVGHLGKVEYNQMFATIDKALERCEQTFGSSSIPYAKILNRYGGVLTRLGKYQEADSIFTIAKDFWTNQKSNNHELYGSLMDYMGSLYTRGGKFEEATSMFETSLEVLKNTIGTNNTKYAHCLNSYGIMNYHMGELYKAKGHWEAATQIWKNVDGIESNSYSAGLHNLGNISLALSQFEAAADLFEEAVRIRKIILNENDPQYGISLLNLGSSYAMTGRREQAEHLFDQAIGILENALGKDHPFYIDCLNNFAVFYEQSGNFDKAILKQKEVLALQEKKVGKKHPRYAKYLTSLAGFYMSSGNLDTSIQCLDEALAILEENPEDNNIGKVFIILTLGQAYLNKGDYQQAEMYLLKSNDLIRTAKLDTTLDHANTIYYLGKLYNETDQVEKGIEYFEYAKSLFLEIHGVKEKNYVTVLNALASAYSKEGNHTLGAAYFKEAQTVARDLVIEGSKHLSVKEMGPFLVKFNQSQKEHLALGQAQEGFAALAYDNALFYKGYLLQGIVQRSILLERDTSNAADYQKLKSIKRILADEYALPSKDQRQITAYEEEADQLEKSLLRNVQGLKDCQSLVYWQDVQQNLDDGSVAIEFVHFESIQNDPSIGAEYGALLIRRDKEMPVYIPLFTEDQMINSKNYEDQISYINHLYKTSEEKEKTLFNLIYKPLESTLSGITKIYYASTGLMHRLNLSAIEIDEDLVFADKYELIQLGSTRQLVIHNDKNNVEDQNDSILFGGINYDYRPTNEHDKTIKNLIVEKGDPEMDKEEVSDAMASRSIINHIAVTSQDSIRRNESWPYLKWTQVELDAIELVLEDAEVKTQIYNGKEATEEAFKSIDQLSVSPGILHIATHGYFFENVEESVNQGNIELQSYKTSDHSMIRSGLVLARGNYAWQNGEAISKGAEDGILTAFEISQMDLSNTELAVLSACETGLGDIKATEGVYGLQRAFKIAGVDKIIMSLWRVPDFHTQELMSSFYYNWQIDKMSISNALKAAQKSLKRKYPEAFYWAGFVLVE